jgi:FkbM family methyltransferase
MDADSRATKWHRRFGIEPFADVNHLAEQWNYPLSSLFDVGANDGDTAEEMCKAFPEAKIFSFEPHPATYMKLKQRFVANPRVQTVEVAFSSHTGSAEMIAYDELSKLNTLLPDAPGAKRFGFQGRTIVVPAMTIDEFCVQNNIASIDLLKIDTEGFDLFVLEGARAMLQKRAISFVYVEYFELQPKEDASGGALVPFDTFLRPFGYRFIASYNDYITTEGEFFSVSNALFALLPAEVASS